ncbi:MAG: protein kinase [Armatimonadetes bacterium]|nr:protein kinase [Armatimonadota bacterium]
MTQEGRFRQMQICPKCSQNNTITARNCIYCGSSLPLVPLLAKGTVLNNRYIVMHVLGFGGFSAVYLAFDQRLNNRRVAVKELLQTDTNIIQQFETEAKILATLSHPALPKAYDWFKQFGSDRYYLVMEFVDGISVWDLVQQKGMLTPLTAMQIIEPVLDAVAYLHNQNPPIIHRDIKPSNILLSKDRKVYLVDFGIVKVAGPGQKTATGAQGVTPGFSPPEQYLAAGETDVRSDIYALGATLYFMLTAKVPPDVTERLQKEMAGQSSLESIRSVNSAVSPQVEQAIFIAMALKKEQRFNSVNDFRAGLKGQTILIQTPAAQSMPHPPVQPIPSSHHQSFGGQPMSPQMTPQQQPANAQPMPVQPTPAQPPVVGGIREWCPACKANFYLADPSLEWIHCPNCGQLIHRQVARYPLASYGMPQSPEIGFKQLLANKRLLIRIGAIIAVISLLVLPLVSCGEITVTGIDMLQSEM